MSERCTVVTPSEFRPEREAFGQLQEAMPDGPPYRAWSNFMFVADTGHCPEVDTLILGPGGLYLIEVKSLTGRLTADGQDWVQHPADGGPPRRFRNPLFTTGMKARQLRGLLNRHRGRGHDAVPWITAAVYLSKRNLTVDLPTEGIFGLPRGLADIRSLITAEPQNDRDRITAVRARQIEAIVRSAGIAESARAYHVGMWNMDRKPLDVSDTWQDHLATHLEAPAERRRIRLYLVEPQATAGSRASVERAARRELAALSGIDHPGIVRVDNLDHHTVGPALVYRHNPRSVRLDRYLANYGAALPMSTRIGLVRQVAEAVAHAHSRRLYHRALSAKSVMVVPAPLHSGAAEQETWLEPRLEIIDWNLASRGPLDPDGTPVNGTVHLTLHSDGVDDVYLAPEWWQRDANPVALDVYGVGTLAFALLTGQAPATSAAELKQRMTTGGGLRPSLVDPKVSEYADAVVEEATQPAPSNRLASMEIFLEFLNEVDVAEAGATGRTTGHHARVDPLKAGPLDRVGEWTIEALLGAGSVSRAFVARHDDGSQHVLKVARSEDRAPMLEHEAAVLRRLRNDSRVIRLVRPDVTDLCGRSALVFEYISRDTLSRRLRSGGPLSLTELETYGDQLIDTIAFLEGEAVHHRDVKPENIVIRTKPNGTTAPVLFDFSLAAAAATDLRAGTPGYLDPFLGLPGRPHYDDAAERYALAVTLHEMVSGQLPVWGDGGTEPTVTTGPPVLAVTQFPAALREGLTAFFHRALDRSATGRFASLTDMRLAWLDLFRGGSSRPVAVPAVTAVQQKEKPTATGPAAHAEPVPKATATGPVKAASAPSTPPAGGGSVGSPIRAQVEQARSVVQAALRERRPLPMATVDRKLRKAMPGLVGSGWAGAGSLNRFITDHLPWFIIAGDNLDLREEKAPPPPSAKVTIPPPAKATKTPPAKTPSTPPAKEPAKAPAKADTVTVSAKDLRAIEAALQEKFAAHDRLAMGTVGGIVKQAAPTVWAAKYGGTGSLANFVKKHLPAYRTVTGEAGGFLLPPAAAPATAKKAPEKVPFVRVPMLLPGRDGLTLYTSGRDRAVHQWNLRTGAVVRTLTGHGDLLAQMRLDPSGTVLATASYDKAVRLWSVADGRLLRTLHGVGARWMAFSPDGRLLATAAKEPSVSLWRVDDGQRQDRLTGHQGDVLRVSFTHDGGHLLTTARDRTMRLWNLTTGATVHRLTGVESPRQSAFSSRAGWLALSAADSGTVSVLALYAGERLTDLVGHHTVTHLAASHDGALLAVAGSDGVTRIWDPLGGRLVNQVLATGRPPARVIFGPDRLLATIDDRGAVRLYDANTGAVVRVLDDGGGTAPWLAIAPDGRWVATAAADNSIRVWDLWERRDPVLLGRPGEQPGPRAVGRAHVPAPRAQSTPPVQPDEPTGRSWLGRLINRTR